VFIRAGGESVWLSPTINCMAVEGQPPTVTMHAQVQELVQRWVEQSKSMREKTEAPPGVAIVLTQDTATIAGVHTRRLNITDSGVFQGEMWVAPTEAPASIRDAGQRLLAALPPDYWRWVHGHPGYSEIILAYGIPLRHRLASGKDLEVLPSGSSAPSWVDPLQAACAQKHASGGIERTRPADRGRAVDPPAAEMTEAIVTRVVVEEACGFCSGEYYMNQVILTPKTLVRILWARRGPKWNVTTQRTLTREEWIRVTSLLDANTLATFKGPIGCPGCVDQPTDGVEVDFSDGTTKSVLYSVGEGPAAAKAFVALIDSWPGTRH
jgi:hypothetical protein